MALVLLPNETTAQAHFGSRRFWQLQIAKGLAFQVHEILAGNRRNFASHFSPQSLYVFGSSCDQSFNEITDLTDRFRAELDFANIKRVHSVTSDDHPDAVRRQSVPSEIHRISVRVRRNLVSH
jgi:hypothetical protein